MSTKFIDNTIGVVLGLAMCYAIFAPPLQPNALPSSEYWGGFHTLSAIALALSYALLSAASVCAIFAVVAITIQTKKDEAFAMLVLVPFIPLCGAMYQSACRGGIAVAVIAGAVIGLTGSLIVSFHVRRLDKRAAQA